MKEDETTYRSGPAQMDVQIPENIDFFNQCKDVFLKI